MKQNGFTLIELLIASVLLMVLAAIAIPNFTRGQRRAKEAEVKSVAHALQMAVEDYKALPGRDGVKPTEADILAYLIPCFMPGMIRNPFNPYDNRFIRGGPPDSVGRIGYQYFGQDNPYIISAMGGTPGVIILTLIEGE